MGHGIPGDQRLQLGRGSRVRGGAPLRAALSDSHASDSHASANFGYFFCRRCCTCCCRHLPSGVRGGGPWISARPEELPAISWIDLDWIGLRWIRFRLRWIVLYMDWLGLSWLWIGLYRVGLDWVGFRFDWTDILVGLDLLTFRLH